MKFVSLKKEEFEQFARAFQNKCYLQSCAVASFRKKNGWESHFLGVKDGERIVAATILFAKKRHKKKEFYALRGPLVDFTNEDLTTFFFTHLKKYVQANQGSLLRIDPYLEAVSRDRDGKETDLFDNRYVKKTLKKLGFQEVCAKEMTDTVQAKWMYVLDLEGTLEDVMKGMDSKTRQMIRKNEKMGITIRQGKEEDLPCFADIMNHTSKRRNFIDRGPSFYENMYAALKDEKMISFVFAELNTDIALQNIKNERKEIEEARQMRNKNLALGKCNQKKAKAKDQEEQQLLERLKIQEEKMSTLAKTHGKKITLGAILYIFYEDEIASLFGGSYDTFKEFQPFYTIHYEMIKYAIENGYKRYNFYAINNHLNKEDSQYGIYLFKRGFGGHVIELLGEFVLPIGPVQYGLYKIKKYLKKYK